MKTGIVILVPILVTRQPPLVLDPGLFHVFALPLSHKPANMSLSKSKKRKFNEKWFKQAEFKWLRVDDKKCMYCMLCEKNGRKNMHKQKHPWLP